MTTASATTTTSSASPQSATQSSTTGDSHSGNGGHGLSSYSEAAIGAAIGGVALLAILAFAIRLLIRRRRTNGHIYGPLGYETDKGPQTTSSGVHEANSSELSELPSTVPRAELPGDEVHYLMKR